MHPLIAHPTEALAGRARVPGDKSISHRAVILAGLAVGETEVQGLLEGDDVLRSIAAMRALGAEIDPAGNGRYRIWGRGVGGLVEPDDVLDFGNAGTGARLFLGLLAGHPLRATLTGDASLRRRPMERVMAPLREMGAQFLAREGGLLPITVTGAERPLPIRYILPVPSAQVKSAVLLAGLNAPGETRVVEPIATRDHTERMLRGFGADIERVEGPDGPEIVLTGQPELRPQRLRVPADPSSAAFPLVAALLLPGSQIRLADVGLNPQRSGLLATLREMGADIRLENAREEAGEPVADLLVHAGPLEGVEVPPERAPSMIDEYPILAVAAACARGRTVMTGLGELRVKESDRLAAIAEGLAACGVEVEAGSDSLGVHGRGCRPAGDALIRTGLDHRIAMSFLVLGLAAEAPVTIDDATPIATSFPGFAELMGDLGALFSQP